METLGSWLLRNSAEGALLILTVLAVTALLGRHLGPRWRVLLWTLVGVKLLVPAGLPFSPGLGSWRASVAEHTGMPMERSSREWAPVNRLGPTQFDSFGAAQGRARGRFGDSAAEPSHSRRAAEGAFALLLVWASGVIVFWLAVVTRQLRFDRRSRFDDCRDPVLLELVHEVARETELGCDFRVVLARPGTTPAVCGIVDRRLILPRDWEIALGAESLRPILMHELEHFRQRDVLLNWVATAIHSLHWFNPLVWVAAARFQSDRELRCDANALARLKASERIGYGRALLRVQREFCPTPAVAGMAPCVRNHPTLHQRILMIAKPTPRKRWLDAILAPGFAGLIALCFGSAVADDERSGPPREGDRPRESGDREGGRRGEGEGGRKREGDRRENPERDREDRRRRDGEGPREGAIHVFVVPDGVRLGDRHVPMSALRGELTGIEARRAVVSAEGGIPFSRVNEVVDALRDAGIRDVQIAGSGRPPHREGEGPRKSGPRDGEGPRKPGPRDGEGPRKAGPRDGEI